MVIMVCSRPCCCCAPQCAVSGSRIPLRSFQMEGDQFELVAKQGTEGRVVAYTCMQLRPMGNMFCTGVREQRGGAREAFLCAVACFRIRPAWGSAGKLEAGNPTHPAHVQVMRAPCALAAAHRTWKALINS